MAAMTVLLAGVVCAVFGALVYSNTLDLGLCYDDEAAVVKNPDLSPNVSWTALLGHDFWGTAMEDKDSHKSYRPLCVASFRLNYMLHGLQPMGYHLVNVLLHAMVCYLYVQLCALVFTQVWPALLAGLLFAVHPIHTEAVAGVVGRADVLACVLFLCALLTYRWMLLSRRPWVWLPLPLLCCFSSALSKETGVTSTVVCLVYEYCVHHQMCLHSSLSLLRQWKKAASLPRKKMASVSSSLPPWFCSFMLRVLVMSLCTGAFVVFRLWLNQGSPKFSVQNNPAMGFATPHRQLHWGYLVFYNIQLLLAPSALTAECAMGTIPPISSLLDYRNMLSAVALAGLALLGWASVTARSPIYRAPLLLGISLMVFPFLPASNLFFPVGFVVAERVLYLPSMGYCLLLALGAWHLGKVYPTVVRAGVAYLIVVHSAKTLVRNRDWYSSMSVFRSAVAVHPNNGKMLSNIGSQLETDGNRTLSIEFFRHAIRVEPHFITSYSNLAYALRGVGDMDEALQVYQQAADLVTRGLAGEDIHVTPKNTKVYNSLSNMLREQAGDAEGALKYARRAVELDPGWENTHHSMANALVLMGRLEQAKAAFEKALDINPEFALAHSNYGDCLQKLGAHDNAEHSYRESLRLDSTHGLTKFRLASLISTGATHTPAQLWEAEKLLKDVLELEPDNGNATSNMGIVYFELGVITKAEEFFQRTLTLTPGDKGTLYNLGVLLAGEGRWVESISRLEELIERYPNDVRAQSQLGTCYMQSNQTSQARATFDHVLQLAPNNTMTLQNYGLLCIHDGDHNKALDLMSRLLEVQPNNEPVQRQVQHLHRAMSKDKHSS